MPRTLTLTTTTKIVYKLEELDEATQQRAHEKWQLSNQFHEDFTYDMAVEAALLLGIVIDTREVRLMNGETTKKPCIYYSGFASQGDGAHFEGSYAYAKHSYANVVKAWPKDETLQGIAKDLQGIQKRHFYRLRAAVRHSGHYQHSGCTNIEVEHSDDRYRDIGSAEDGIKQALREFMDWIYKRLEEEYDYQQSLESFKACVEDREFDEEGDTV